MTITWTPTDVPTVSTEDLSMPMRILIDQGRGLALFRGLTDYDRQRLRAEFWTAYAGDEAQGHAILMRLDALVDVFAAQRLKDTLLTEGFMMIWKAISVAASMRLNAEWGFNPQKFIWTLRQQDALSVRPVTAGKLPKAGLAAPVATQAAPVGATQVGIGRTAHTPSGATVVTLRRLVAA